MLRAMNVAHMATPYVERYVTRLVTVRRQRTLPFPGRVTRRLGERVAAESIIAEADVPRGYHLIELDQVLHRRVRDARRYPAGSQVRRRRILDKRLRPWSDWTPGPPPTASPGDLNWFSYQGLPP